MENTKVLVVEDNALNMKLVRSLLHMGNYEILESTDGESGLMMMREHQPDIVLMDIQLPGMNGLEATNIIRKDPGLKNIPVVALTSHAMSGDKQRALDAGCVGYITKPLDTRTFLKTVKQYIPEKISKPIIVSDEVETDREAPDPSKNSSKKYLPKILIVDDEPLNTKLLAAQIPADQYTVIQAFSGQEALEIAENIRPELILLDVMMPVLNGYDVTRQLKASEITCKIPIILITALQGTDDKVRGLEAGAEEFLSKPVNTVELLARINSMIRLRRYREQLTLRVKSEEQLIGCDSNSLEISKGGHPKGTILLVEDNEKDVRLIKGHLNDLPYELLIAQTGEEAIKIAEHKPIDVVLVDILLPGIDGFQVCSELKGLTNHSKPQVVIVTCLDDLDSKVKGAELGADDFLIKPIDGRIFRARIKALMEKKKHLDKLQSHYEIAVNSAIMDGLTGLYNHAYLKQALEMEIKRSLRQKYPTALMMLDLDDFKRFNDTYGHLAGDRVLSETAHLLKSCVRETDLVARYGGEEFCIVLPYAGEEESYHLSQRILQTVSTHRFGENNVWFTDPITVSIGVASCPSNASTVPELIEKADAMLYAAKNEGKNRVRVY